MEEFLRKTVLEIRKLYHSNINNLSIISPNKRSMSAVKKIAGQYLNIKTFNTIQFYTIESLIEELSGLTKVNILELCSILYKITCNNKKIDISFERFYVWGLDLIKDFDEIDKHLIKASTIFSNIYNYNTIKDSLPYLTEEQITIIKGFWSIFNHTRSKYQDTFLDTYKTIINIYNDYTAYLINNKKAYNGLQYKHIVNMLKENKLSLKKDKIAFIGFNFLYPSEEFIFKWLDKNIDTTFWWDIDSYYMEDENQEAGLYLRKYYNNKIFKNNFPSITPNNIKNQNKSIEIKGCNTNAEQINGIREKIAEVNTQSKTKKKIKTAIIVLDYNLLVPLIDSLPQSGDYVVTMGHPMSITPLYDIIIQTIDIIAAKNKNNNPDNKNEIIIESIIHNAYIQKIIRAEESNISVSDISIIAYIKNIIDTIIKYPNYVIKNIIELINYIKLKLEILNNDNISQIELQSFTTLNNLFTILNDTIKSYKINTTYFEIFKIIKLIMSNSRIPVDVKRDLNTNHTIYIMGILETRNIDFNNVFILSMNENTYPKTITHNSFIPYSLRLGYKLPTFAQHNKSIYAYYFYRLLHQANNVFITYNTSYINNKNGEISSYLLQLMYESQLNIKLSQKNENVSIQTTLPIVIEKTQHVNAQIKNFIKSTPITPSIINTYLSCTLKFYFKYISKIKYEETQSSNLLLGKIFHNCMQQLYYNYVNKELTKKDIAEAKLKIDKYINDPHFNDNFVHPQKKLILDLAKNMVMKTLNIDYQYAPFKVVAIEEKITYNLNIDSNITISLAGIIDRIDKKNNTLRIIDYKTSNIENKAKSIESLFSREKSNNTLVQALTYAYITHKRSRYNDLEIQPVIIGLNKLFSEESAMKIVLSYPIDNITPYVQEIEEEIKKIINLMINNNEPFTQTEDIYKCQSCPYNNICQRR